MTHAHAQTTNNNTTTTNTPPLTLLEEAYTALAQADHDYDGHRGAAMEAIKAAAHELGGKVEAKGKGHEKQAASDDQLKAAKDLLQQVEPNLSGKSLKHVKNAIEQIDKALEMRTKK
jgi:hypothetical protein